MQINAFSTPPAPGNKANAAPAPTVPHALHSDKSFAQFLNHQTEHAAKPAGEEKSAQNTAKTRTATKAPAAAPAPAAPARKLQEATPAEAAADKKAAPSASAASDAAATAAKAAEPAVADITAAQATPGPSETPAPDNLNPWMALMQSLAAAQAPAAPPAGGDATPSGPRATTDPADALRGVPGSGTSEAAGTTRIARASDAAALAAGQAAQPESSSARFGTALAASLAAQPAAGAGATGSEWRARERDAASTALPADNAATQPFAGLIGATPTPSHAPAAAVAASAINLPVPVDSPQFAPTLAASVSVLAREGVQEARINLHPAEMGPITVQIAVDGTQARVDFSADMAATRSALEAGLPELASALRDAGLTLSGGGVFDQAQSGRQPAEAQSGRPSRVGARGSESVEAVAGAPAGARRVSLSGLDEYA